MEENGAQLAPAQVRFSASDRRSSEVGAGSGPVRDTRSVPCTAIEGFRVREGVRDARRIQTSTPSWVFVSFVRHLGFGAQPKCDRALTLARRHEKLHGAQFPVVVRLDRLSRAAISSGGEALVELLRETQRSGAHTATVRFG